MKILLSNDDGIAAAGIKALAAALAGKGHSVLVCAPYEQQSGMGHAITVNKDMVLRQSPELVALGAEFAASLTATPADCVKIYLEAMAADYPDLIISGINDGANLGTDVLYSGTVGAALEGYMHGINTLAVSVPVKSSVTFELAASLVAAKIPEFIAGEQQPFFLNINFPKKFAADFIEKLPNGEEDNAARYEKLWRFCALGHRDYLNAYDLYNDGGRVYYRLAGEICDGENEPHTDIYATHEGFIAVTPLCADLADVEALRRHGLVSVKRRPLIKQSNIK